MAYILGSTEEASSRLKRTGPLAYHNVGLIVASVDGLAILLASLMGESIYSQVFVRPTDLQGFFAIGTIAAALFVLQAAAWGLYRVGELVSDRTQLESILTFWVFAVLGVTFVLFILKAGATYSRGSMLTLAAVGAPLLPTLHHFAKRWVRRAIVGGVLSGCRSIVIGARQELSRISGQQLLERYGAVEVARLELPDGLSSQRAAKAAIEVCAGRKAEAEQVLLAVPWAQHEQWQALCDTLRQVPVPVYLLPDQTIRPVLTGRVRELGAGIAVEMLPPPLSPSQLLAKRALDIGFGLTCLVAMLPLFAMVAIVIVLDSGRPVIFRQQRRGFNGRVFSIYKFRTMVVTESEDMSRQACRNDHRVTRVGRILRKISIDELPQLLNVLRGEMSLVGPRPHPVALDTQYSRSIVSYAFRHHVKPGITGWAQVNGYRGETREPELMRKRVECDYWYILNWSIWLDLWILARTCFEVVRTRNAY
jgi:undecaprenyl-phosphate galactose phosphotransferase/putative colanic acid biosynthesis UDP-glucose lipid carrier transferase